MKQISAEQQESLEKLLIKYGGVLLRHKGVVDVGVGYLMKDNRVTDEVGIVVYTKQKKSEAQLEADEVLPKYIEGVRVDVVEANPTKQLTPYDVFDELVGGINIANTSLKALGTLGCIVYDNATNEPLGLSNWHILKKNKGREGDIIVQPGNKRANKGFNIGRLARWNKQLDCGVFKVEGKVVNNLQSFFEMAGRISGITKAVGGMKVKKAGARTRITYGQVFTVNLNGVVIVPNPEKPAPNNEISRGGDSGSLWVTDDEQLNAVALHHSGEPNDSPTVEKAWGYSIDKIASILNFKFQP